MKSFTVASATVFTSAIIIWSLWIWSIWVHLAHGPVNFIEEKHFPLVQNLKYYLCVRCGKPPLRLSVCLSTYLCNRGWGAEDDSSPCCSDNTLHWATCGSECLFWSRRRSSSGEHMPTTHTHRNTREHSTRKFNTQASCDAPSLVTKKHGGAAQRCCSPGPHDRGELCVCVRLCCVVLCVNAHKKRTAGVNSFAKLPHLEMLWDRTVVFFLLKKKNASL